MDATNDALQLIAQPVDDRSNGTRYVIWATTRHSNGLPLSEVLVHKYRSITELLDFIVAICTPTELLLFDFELLYNQLSQGQRYFVELPQSVAANLGFITNAKAASGSSRGDSLSDSAAVA